MENQFSFKDLYNVSIKSTQTMEINGKRIEAGEIIGYFDKIQLSNFQEVKEEVAARGGWDNRGHVFWTTVKEVNLLFTQGVFSKTQLALMLNAKLAQMVEDQVQIQQRETLETDEDGKVTLKFTPLTSKLFIYGEDGNKINNYTIDGKVIQLSGENTSYKNLIIDYSFVYDNSAEKYEIGKQLFNGFVELEGRTRIKEDVTGKICTGIIRIPKMRIMSNFSMRLGNQATPYLATLQGIGVPDGSRRDSKVMEFILLNNDIDSDI